MNNKAFITELFMFIVIGIIVIAFFGTMIYGFAILKTKITDTSLNVGGLNISTIGGNTLGKLSDGINNLRLMAFIMMVGYIIATFVMAYFSTKHPIWLFVYIVVSILMVIFSIYIANAYDGMMSNSAIAGILTGFTASGTMVHYLPYIVTIVAFVGILLSIVGITMSRRIYQE